MNRFTLALQRFFAGRRGMDEMGLATYAAGFILYIISWITGLKILNLLGFALWVYSLFRMLSKNLVKRAAENTWFLGWFSPIALKCRQAVNRFKNRKVYKYFRCPKCKSWLKLPRNVGEKVVTCGKCGERVRKKA